VNSRTLDLAIFTQGRVETCLGFSRVLNRPPFQGAWSDRDVAPQRLACCDVAPQRLAAMLLRNATAMLLRNAIARSRLVANRQGTTQN